VSVVTSHWLTHSPCCRGRWSWRCRPALRRRTAAPPRRCGGCFPRVPPGWSPSSGSAPGGCCHRPASSRGCRGTPGTPPAPCSPWSCPRPTDLGWGGVGHWWSTIKGIYFDCRLIGLSNFNRGKNIKILWFPLLKCESFAYIYFHLFLWESTLGCGQKNIWGIGLFDIFDIFLMSDYTLGAVGWWWWWWTYRWATPCSPWSPPGCPVPGLACCGSHGGLGRWRWSPSASPEMAPFSVY